MVNISRAFVVILLYLLLAGCLNSSSDECDLGSSSEFEVVELSPSEKAKLITSIESVLGARYVWGGDSPDIGFDCSGLIQWAYRQQGFGFFINQDRIKCEITAHDLFHQNAIHVSDFFSLERGDFIFFDESGDGRITHNAVFDHVDEEGRVWVYDAYSISSIVTFRAVENFWSKGPYFAKASKIVKR